MKKLFYTLVLLVVLAASFTACTDENVKPRTNDSGGGGEAYDPKGK